MGKSIYTYYKERLIEIGGNNKCLYLKNAVRRNAYDIGRLLEGRDVKVSEFTEFLWSDKRYPFPLINQKEKKEIVENLEINSRLEKRQTAPPEDATPELIEKINQKNERIRRDEANRAVEAEITRIKHLKREVEEIERETGRYELFIGYPFVFGALGQGSSKTVIKAPLLLFPVKIDIPDEGTVEIRFNEQEKIRINPALIFAYAQAKRMRIDQLELEFDSLDSLPNVSDVIAYLRAAHIKFEHSPTKNVFCYSRFKEPEEKGELSVRYGAVLARFPLSNSIYSDYTLLEKKKLTNDAIDELLKTGARKRKPKKKKAIRTPKCTYTVKMLDYAQSEVVNRVAEKGNMVIYGPPGTGKSQTIVNVITDAVSKNKKVLVVSQKKAALDVVYNRLGSLNLKCMYITDEAKEKRSFYDKCYDAHQRLTENPMPDVAAMTAEYNEIEKRILREKTLLDTLDSTLNSKRPFGLSLSEMYSSSSAISKSSPDYDIYTRLAESADIMSLSYSELSEALFSIKGTKLQRLYYDFMQAKEKNPLIDLMQRDIDIPTLAEVKAELSEIQKSRKGLFNTAKYPYYRHVMAYYKELTSDEVLDAVVKLEARVKYPGRLFYKRIKREIKAQLIETINAVDKFADEYKCLLRVLTEDGYISVIDNVLRGNTSYVKLVYEALDGYIAMRDMTNMLASLDNAKIAILNFAYSISKSYANYSYIIEKLPELRIYHELISYEEICKDELAIAVDYQSIREKIIKLKEAELSIAANITDAIACKDYLKLYNSGKDNKDYLYQISKKQKFWPIRRTVELYGQYILELFPCWLLSPENVSSILPLTKNLFDVVIFDEASQVFIESTIPTIYRGKSIVVAGDAKQLRPSTAFMKRYLGTDSDTDDVSMQAALEVDSLLDLAVARYESANLTYHYRSRHSELIDFSNAAFYYSALQIAPNVSRNKKSRPIERLTVKGKWVDRKNLAEAKRIIELLYDIFKNRQNNESVGIITFNTEQQSCIADLIDKEMAKSDEFRSLMTKEKHRFDNGEDTSIFIKNLENVQGDERDIIIFSIGYANNEEGRLYANFGSLSLEGGENRLNVAITRAKSKIYVVTSIEPEDLKVEGAKHLGPKLLKKYLTYVRAVSNDDADERRTVLSELGAAEVRNDRRLTTLLPIEEQIKEKLQKAGYKVDVRLGNENARISLAVYDEKQDKYLVGVELDRDAYESSDSTLERDVYKPMFLESKGWNLIRIWSRDWWLYPAKVIKTITDAAEAAKKSTKAKTSGYRI